MAAAEEVPLVAEEAAVAASETVTMAVVVDSEIDAVDLATVTVAEVDSAVVVVALVIVIAEAVALAIEAASEAVEVIVVASENPTEPNPN